MAFYLLLLSPLPATLFMGAVIWRWRARFSEAGALLAWFFGMLFASAVFGQAGALRYVVGDWAALVIAWLLAPALYAWLWAYVLGRTRFRVAFPAWPRRKQ